MYVHFNKGEMSKKFNLRKSRPNENRNPFSFGGSPSSLYYIKSNIDSLIKSLSDVNNAIKGNIILKKDLEASETSITSPPSPRSNFPPSFKTTKLPNPPIRRTPSQSPKHNLPSQSPKHNPPSQSPKHNPPSQSPKHNPPSPKIDDPKTPSPSPSPKLDKSSNSTPNIKSDLIENVSSKDEMTQGFKSYFSIKPESIKPDEKSNSFKENAEKQRKNVESENGSSDEDTNEPLVPMKTVPFNFLLNELFKVVFLNLPPETSYDDVLNILLANGFQRDEIDDIMLISQVHQSVATISFEKKNSMMHALELNQKMTYKERLITVKENRTDSAAKKNTQKCSEIKNKSKRKFQNDGVDTPPHKR